MFVARMRRRFFAVVGTAMRISLAAVVLAIVLAVATNAGLAAPRHKKSGQGVTVSHKECVAFHTRKGMRWKAANKRCNFKNNRIPKKAVKSSTEP